MSTSIIVHVLNAPPSISCLGDITYTYNTTGHAISWIIMDASTGIMNYEIFRNNTSLVNGSWSPGVAVVRNVDSLAIGTYNFTIVASDGLGESVVNTVIVTVTSLPPISPPTVSGYPIVTIIICSVACLAFTSLPRKRFYRM